LSFSVSANELVAPSAAAQHGTTVNTAEPTSGETGGSILAAYREIILDTWHYRDLLVQMTLRDVKIRYKQAVMGFAWAIFMPLLIVAAGVFIRSALAYASGADIERQQIAAIALKALPWSFFVGSVGFATATLSGNMQLVSKVYFPREVLPLSAVLAQLFDFRRTAHGAAAVGSPAPADAGGLHHGRVPLSRVCQPVLP
jgi:hypothetical protein